MEIKLRENFRKQIKRLLKKYTSLDNDLVQFGKELIANPGIVAIEPDTNVARKVRMQIKSKGKGKSSGARVIYYIVTEAEEIYLLEIYDKSEYTKFFKKNN